VPLEARKFASLDEAHALAVEHDLWPELRAYVERVKTCDAD
jgi:hypothetical protein